ncbi:hypothetical protein PIB30_048138 [Stylosanthes scabra]|uniref:Uncharacterized protein n=1 Tax=Stylosanthes scabra TaxID=79078 RepID=A0ABU6THR0_9FABA|nr:hypothetical protein [Stylosanthes scabra]
MKPSTKVSREDGGGGFHRVLSFSISLTLSALSHGSTGDGDCSFNVRRRCSLSLPLSSVRVGEFRASRLERHLFFLLHPTESFPKHLLYFLPTSLKCLRSSPLSYPILSTFQTCSVSNLPPSELLKPSSFS